MASLTSPLLILLLLLPFPFFLFVHSTPDGAALGAGDAVTGAAAERPMSQYNKTQRDSVIQLLGQWRSQVKPRADPSEMNSLIWNDELASLAQAQADRCTYKPGYPHWNETLSILSTKPGRRIGQANWAGWNGSWATHYWNKEGEWYDYCENRCHYDYKKLKSQGFYRSSVVYYFRGCVNYTNMVWSDTRHVGCGHRVCGFENYHFHPGSDHHVCYFFPGAILEFPESERLKRLPYKTLKPLEIACGAESLSFRNGRWWSRWTASGLSIVVGFFAGNAVRG